MKHPRIDKTLQGLVSEARLHKTKTTACWDPGAIKPIRRLIKGWSILLSLTEHDGVDHWHFSAQLYPHGRSSTKADWKMLGYITAGVQTVTGCPLDGPDVEPLTPFETTDPNRVHHWAWHGDGSPIDPHAKAQLQAILNPDSSRPS